MDDVATSWLQNHRTLAAFGLVALALLALTNLPWQLDDYDQAKQAFASFEIVKDGRWLYQHTSDNHVATKPPLLAWTSVAIYAVTRSWDIAWRLPSFACAIGIAIALSRTATRAWSGAAGVIATLAFVFNLLTPRLASLVRSDMPLAFVTLLIGLRIFEKVRTREPWHTRDRLTMFGLLTAAMLIKGPIVYAFILPGIVAFQLLRKERTVSAWCGWWPWLASLAIFAAWVAGGIAWMPNFYEEVVLREFAGRFGQTVHRPQPFYFYLPHLIHKFAPWSVLMIALAVLAYRKTRQRFWDSIRSLSPETLWLIAWGIGGIILMSLIPSKRVDRIYPAIPPLCLLLSMQLVGMEAARLKRWIPATIILAVLFTVGYAGARVFTGYHGNRAALSNFGREVRLLSQQSGWHLEVVGKTDEGVPIYFDRPHFTTPDRATADWNTGAVNALAVPVDRLPRFTTELQNFTPPQMESAPRAELRDRPNYVLLTR